jgi:hypothetical protein
VATFYAARSEIITPLPWLTFALPFSTCFYLKRTFVTLVLNEPELAKLCVITHVLK